MTLTPTNYEIENADVYRTSDLQYCARVTIVGPDGDRIKRIGKPIPWNSEEWEQYQIELVKRDLVRMVEVLK